MARESIEVLKECEAFLEGHFLLSSGRHSGAYCQMAYLQQYPDKCAEVMAHVAEKLKDTDVDVIVGPAMGGIVYAYELGRQNPQHLLLSGLEASPVFWQEFPLHAERSRRKKHPDLLQHQQALRLCLLQLWLQ